MYLYGNTMLPSLEDGFLYHFTSASSLMKILEDMTLKLSTFDNLNDLNEKEIKFVLQDWLYGLETKKFIAQNCKLISFSQNFQWGKVFCECGCNHPRMWAQYAENNKGACIVINENKLIEQNKHILNPLFWKIENVKYEAYMSNESPIKSDNPESFIKKNYRTIFYEKHKDWQQEDERRFMCIAGPDFLSINGCIEFICLGNKFENENYEKLCKIIISSAQKGFIPLTPHDFTFQLNAQGRSLPMDNASRIVKYIEQNGDEVDEYFNCLSAYGYTN